MGWEDEQSNQFWYEGPGNWWSDEYESDDLLDDVTGEHLGDSEEDEEENEDWEDQECDSCNSWLCENCGTCVNCEKSLDATRPCKECRENLASKIQCRNCKRNFCSCRLPFGEGSEYSCRHLMPVQNFGLMCEGCYQRKQIWEQSKSIGADNLRAQVDLQLPVQVGRPEAPIVRINEELEGEAVDLVHELKNLRSERLILERREKKLRASLLSVLGSDPKVGTILGKTVISIEIQARAHFDSRAFKKDHPEMLQAYTDTREVIILKTF